MSSTNKTAELQLSQFVGTDIPSILTDYNGDMRKIDAGVLEVKQATAGAVSDLSSVTARVTNTEQSISGLNSTVQGIATRVVGAEGDIDALQTSVGNLETAVNTKADASAVSALQGDVDNIETVIPSTASASNKLATMSDIDGGYTLALTLNNVEIIRNEGTARNQLNAFLSQNVDAILSHNKSIKVFEVESDTLREVNCAVSHFGEYYMIQIYSPVACTSSGVKGGEFQYSTSEPNSASSYDFAFDNNGNLTLRNNVDSEATYSSTYAIYITD